MKKLGCFFNIAVFLFGTTLPVLSQTPPVNLEQLVNQWGYTRVNCNSNVVKIRYGQNTVCVSPTPPLQPGDYTYDPVKNQLVSVNSEPNGITPQFSFTSLADYTRCIEDILLLYTNRDRFQQQPRKSNCLADTFQAYTDSGLTKEQALEMIKAAHEYVSTALTVKFYPLRGLREQIARLFGYVYDIDANDPEIQKMVTEGSS